MKTPVVVPRPARALVLALSVLLPSNPLAAGPARIAVTDSARDFLAGEAKGAAVTADGQLTLGLPLSPRAWPDDAAGAVVFCAAADAAGRVWVATGGGQGKLYVSEPDGTVRLAFTAPEPNVTAVAVAPDGTVLCGTSPGAKVYRVDPKGKDPAAAGTQIGDCGEAAVWALVATDSAVYAGTGNKGRLYRRQKDGPFALLAELEDTHVRSLALGKDGTVYAGTSEKGLVVSVNPAGVLRTLHDSGKPEVSGLAVAPDGTLYGVATSTEVPALSPRPVADPRRPAPAPSSTPPAPPPREEVPQGSVSVSTGPARLAPAASPPPSREGSAEVVSIATDGFVEPAWTLPEDTVYGMRFDAASGRLFLSTGRGRVYSLRDRALRLEVQVDQRQVVAAVPVRGGLALVTANAPGVLRPAAVRPPATFTSAVRDAGRLATFGLLRFEGTLPKGTSARFAVRSGNSEKPEKTWTDWVAVTPEAPLASPLPTGRFLQFRVELGAGPGDAVPVVDRVELSYVERNARPVLEALSVLEPGAILPRGGALSGPAVLSVTNPDESGIFAGLEAPRDPNPTPDPAAKKLYRKGFRTVVWKGTDPNGDALRYDVEGRRDGEGPWFPVRKDLDEASLAFDSTALPDGRYRFRVTASDRGANPEPEALTAVQETEVVLLDATPPVLEAVARKVDGERLSFTISAKDALSPVTRAEGAVNADRWRLLAAEDGLADGRSERFTLTVPKPGSPAVLAIRVVDAAGNSAVMSAEYPGEFR